MDSDNIQMYGPSPSSSSSQERLRINATSPSNEEDSASARKRTRASPDQLAILEKSFSLNPSPNNRVREQLSRELNMSERSIQIWFQNRRAKVKNIAKKSSILYDETMKTQQYAIAAANAACQAAAFHEQQASPGTPIKTNSDLYYYYYYYYFNYRQQEQQQQQRQKQAPSSQTYSQSSSSTTTATTATTTTAPTPPPPTSMISIPPPPPPPPPIPASFSAGRNSSPSNTLSSDISPHAQPWAGKQSNYQGTTRTRAHTIGPSGYQEYMKNKHVNRGNSIDLVQDFSQYDASNYNYISNYNTAIPQPQPQPPRPSSNKETTSETSNRTDIPPNEPLSLIHTDNTMGIPSQQQIPFYNHPQQINWESPPIPHSVGSNNLSSPFADYNAMPYENPINKLILSVSAIKIGTWKRVGYQSQDLLCFFDNQKLAFSWCICDGAQRYKIEFGQNIVQSIKLKQLQGRAGWASLEIEVIPNLIYFYMESATQNTWSQCRDYTEDKQATLVKYHQLDGPILSLKAELDQLVQRNPVLKSKIIQTNIYPSSLTDRSDQ